MRNTVKKLAVILGTITLIIVMVFSPFRFYVFNLNFYLNLYEKNAVFDTVDKQDAIRLTENIFEYFKHKTQFVPFILKNNLPYFTTDEIRHLEDVRVLFNRIFLTYYTCLGLSLIFIIIQIDKNKSNFLKNIAVLLITPSLILIFLLLIIYFMGQNFSFSFEKFHLLFFPQGNYAFPEDSTLITLLPLNFFYDFFERLVFSSIIISVILTSIGITFLIFLRKIKIRAKNERH
ncbi:MAG: DUF1461 domain-containing protein [Cyanobacteria bacterium]|nr:DUF1461 domain-containing protein [Cyanobacteriota bacterium]